MTRFIPFARRQNFDTNIDSICTRCYGTIASSPDPADLAPSEAAPMSDPNGEFNLLTTIMTTTMTTITTCGVERSMSALAPSDDTAVLL